ncbi:16930_t:CDS:2 [Funneliformis geosporum]|uniref:16930_t:CDS:1 n=1 Tax=Funneliformis geosporum TaxID=1117311 RepID=A0A9W4SNK7_9GLOM|nr:16930_t:CDS:2 [Funneliformis geosporum]
MMLKGGEDNMIVLFDRLRIGIDIIEIRAGNTRNSVSNSITPLAKSAEQVGKVDSKKPINRSGKAKQSTLEETIRKIL